MNKKIRFHIIAVASICVLVTVLYQFFGPKPPAAQPQAPTTSNAIAIYSATWGKNCNDAIPLANKQAQLSPARDAQGNAVPHTPLPLVSDNNVLMTIGNLCNAKVACSFAANLETMAADPLVSCFKRLVLTYRCFETDRLRRIEVGQGEDVNLDCNDEALRTDGAAKP
jgi:hypothetical protein